MAGMEEEKRALLGNLRVNLVKDLEPMKLLVHLTKILDEDDADLIKAEKVRSRQAEMLLDMLPRRGPLAFDVFMSALEKKQHHLAKMLAKDSDVSLPDVSEDYQMSESHRQILRNNAGKLMTMDLNRVLPLMSDLLDQDDQDQIWCQKTTSEKVDKFLLEILPRKGPTAFENFVRFVEQTYPSLAQPLLEEAGMDIKIMHKGSSVDMDVKGKPPVEDTGSFNLDCVMQDILELKPQLLNKFCLFMDTENVFGNGWKRLYQELDLPPGRDGAFQSSAGSPTLKIVKAWCQKNGRSATVQKLLEAVKRSEREDCLYNLEQALGCRLDNVDGDVDGVIRRMGALRAKGEKKIIFLGDLNERQASAVASKLNDSILRDQVEKELHLIDTEGSLAKVLMRSKDYTVRQFTEFLRRNNRLDVIETMKSALPNGVTGPFLSPDGNVRDITYSLRAKLTRTLSGNPDCWKLLAERLGMEMSHIQYLDSREKNPSDSVLRVWEVKQNATVGKLYDILVDLGYPAFADIL